MADCPQTWRLAGEIIWPPWRARRRHRRCVPPRMG